MVSVPGLAKRTSDFWGSLVDLYGAQYVSRELGEFSMKNQEVHKWARLINRLTDEQVQKGLESALKDPKDHIPTRKKFYRLATFKVRTHACHQLHQKLLPKSTWAERKAAARIHLDAARKTITGGAAE